MTGIMIGTTDEAGIVATSGIVIGTGTAAAGVGALGTAVVAGAPGHAGEDVLGGMAVMRT